MRDAHRQAGPELRELLLRVTYGPPPSARALAKEPERRMASATLFVAALRAALFPVASRVESAVGWLTAAPLRALAAFRR